VDKRLVAEWDLYPFSRQANTTHPLELTDFPPSSHVSHILDTELTQGESHNIGEVFSFCFLTKGLHAWLLN
jgi:hypothetical protein